MNIWSVLGLSVTFVAIFCVLMLEVFQDKNYYEIYKWYFCGFLIGCGTLLWLLGKFVLGRKKAQDQANISPIQVTSSPEVESPSPKAEPPVRSETSTGEETDSVQEVASPAQAQRLPLEPVIADDSEGAKDTGPFFLFTPVYWGAMLVTFGIIVIFIVPNYSAKKVSARTNTKVVEKAKLAVPPPSTNTEPKPATVEPPKFPALKVQGIIYRPGNASAVVNGKARFVGDYVDEAEVVDIERQSVTVQIRGFKKTYVLEK
jgi:hypothetical protein